MLIQECSEFIEDAFSKYAIILKDGSILKTSIDKDSVDKIFPVLEKLLMKDLKVGDLLLKSPVIFFRVTENVLVILLSRAHQNVVQTMFDVFCERYALRLDQEFPALELDLQTLSKFTIFSLSRQAGPEPIGWWENIDEDIVFKYSTSSLLLLLNEIDGASARTLNFHPFISDKYMSVIFLFQVQAPEARGEAFDASILIMFDYSIRNILYKYNDQFEQILNETADKLAATFIADYAENIQAPIRPESRKKFALILKGVQNQLKQFKIDPTEIKI
ncbi:hypothetical protein NEF87_004397 [Candidatus Lokiarchaeum ossiferum]|uniref:Uncharacterized protein n=1 Tax=Candidatus Lokiarchaeum ossiferum TaxID=2951803 RepID=A0ABY6I0K1_9ARCH|nr:hypothetical protein NEF87_004397 [Candidatus Lokiarchaeum sp. B-35]